MTILRATFLAVLMIGNFFVFTTWLLAAVIPAATVIGLIMTNRLKSTDPVAFDRIGQNQTWRLQPILARASLRRDQLPVTHCLAGVFLPQ